ncbi:MAG: DUF1684 domain-containing protein [Nocardioidaceae bacterium]
MSYDADLLGVTMSGPQARADYESWLTQRHTYVTSASGNLALVGYQPVDAESRQVDGMPVTVRAADSDGVWVAAAPDGGVSVDGKEIDGEIYVERLRPDGSPIVTSGSRSFDVFSLDGSDFELRIYDRDAEALQTFERIDAYPYASDLAVTGRFRPYDDTVDVAWDFTRSTDTGHAKRVPGEIDLELGDRTYALLAFLDGDVLVLVFADGTTGRESYAPGRFLRLPPPDADGNVSVDFNRAIIPPCGFSNSYSCPLPPAQNRIALPIRAGERRVQWETSDLSEAPQGRADGPPGSREPLLIRRTW